MKPEKMTVSWERFVNRPATAEDVAEEERYFAEHGRHFHGEIKVGDELDYEETVELPGKYEVCDRCQGKGSHVNPNIDSHGITMEEWYGPDWDDDSREAYMSGEYDVSCYECHGRRVVLVVDDERCDKQLLEEYYADMQRRAHEEYCDRRTRWAENGYRDDH